MSGPFVIKLPGDPMAEKRPRMRVVAPKGQKPFASVYAHPESLKWREWCRFEMHQALLAAGHEPPLFPDGPVRMILLLTWALPRSLARKTKPVPRKPRDKGADSDNCAKAVMDAGNGILYRDDAQVATLIVHKLTGQQGESPSVIITIEPMDPIPWVYEDV